MIGLVVVALLVLVVQSRSDDVKSLDVEATAYNSLPEQTTRTDSDLAAWGDRLKPGMKAIAVSRDLLEMGLKHRSEVPIDGLPGKWQVMDKMHRRWKRRIDIYMGEDVEAARAWGKQTVTMSWRVDPEEE